jgi:cytochrome oxidase Cu insertion factor (SCO1/SenC/PrrC family)
VSIEAMTPAPEATSRPSAARRRRIALVIIGLWLAVAAVAAVAFWLVRSQPAPSTATSTAAVGAAGQVRLTGIPSTVSTPLAYLMGLSPVPVKQAPAFTFVDQNGHTLSLSSFKGRSVVLEFMDPHCVDICPLVSQEFLNAARDLGPAANGVVFLAINVNRYFAGVGDVATFSQAHKLSSLPSWHFLTGPLPALEASWNAYGIAVSDRGRNADVVHTDTMYFIDPQGREQFAATPVADYTASGTAYLPTSDLVSWGKGIALIARSIA